MRRKLPRIDYSITLDTVGQKPNSGARKSKIVSENRKSIFISKLMPISVMIEPIEPEKSVAFQEQQFFSFLLLVLCFWALSSWDLILAFKSRTCPNPCFELALGAQMYNTMRRTRQPLRQTLWSMAALNDRFDNYGLRIVACLKKPQLRTQ